jgi:hypothetical protein
VADDIADVASDEADDIAEVASDEAEDIAELAADDADDMIEAAALVADDALEAAVPPLDPQAASVRARTPAPATAPIRTERTGILLVGIGTTAQSSGHIKGKGGMEVRTVNDFLRSQFGRAQRHGSVSVRSDAHGIGRLSVPTAPDPWILVRTGAGSTANGHRGSFRGRARCP